MNKKLFLGMFAAAGMLFATSCSNDELDVVQSGNEAQVSFSLGLEGGIATRAISDGTGAKKLVYAVYKLDANGNPVLQNVVGSNNDGQFVDTEAFDNGLTETVSVTLAKGQTYQVAFWAQNPSCTAYTATDLANVKVSYENATNNNDVRDAFFKTVKFTVQGNQTIDVELKRPFAQINVGVYKSDWEAAVKSGIEIEKSSVVIKNAATSINLLTGEVGDETTDVIVKYTSETIPNEDLKVDLNGDKDFDNENEVYKWLSMSYILVADRNADTDNSGVLGDERATLESLQYTFAPKSGNDITFGDGLNSVPVQRNWRTNILGQILTGEIQFNITIKPIFDGDINVDAPVSVVGVAAAQKALDNAVPGTTIQLEPGVNYGTLYLRPSPENPSTMDIDWTGNNYGYESLTVFENLTIVGAEGATVDAIEIEGGTYYNTPHSQSDKYPVMQSLIELKNVIIDGVTFTGKGGYDPQGYGNVINLSGGNIKVDGLTVKNCILNNTENNARLIYKTESTTSVHNYTCNGESLTFVPSLKNITVTDCTLNGGYMGLELRETENVTITNNEFNVADRNILLPANSNCTYSGNVTITGNVSNNAKERFVRADGMGDAVVLIKDNKIFDYSGKDADYIKVTNANNVTIENNTLASTASTAEELKTALSGGKDVFLTNNLSDVEVNTQNDYGTYYGVAHNGSVFDGNDNTLDFQVGEVHNDKTDNWGIMTSGGTIKNLTITGVFRGIMIYNPTQDLYIDNVTIGDDDVCYAINTAEGDGTKSLYVSNSTIKGWSSYGTAIKDLTFTNCTFGQGTYYTDVFGRIVKPYVNTVFDGCEFNSKFYIDLSQLGMDGDGHVLDASAKIVLKNCTVNGVKLTAENWKTLIASESACGEGQISVELKDGSYLTSDNVVDYVVFE